MKIFKLTAILMALAAAFAFSSCGNDDEPAAPETKPALYTLTGSTISSSPSGDSFVNEKSIYKIHLDYTKMTIHFEIVGAQFASAMPALNIDFNDIPFTIDSNKCIKVDYPTEFIPSMANIPQPSFPITNLKMDLDPSQSANIYFNCTLHGRMAYSVKAEQLNVAK